MKKYIKFSLILLLCVIALFSSCKKEPIDNNGLLVTERSECYMSFFDLLGSDNRTVLVTGSTVIDTLNLTVKAVARFGTNMLRLKPYCSVVTDAIVEPNMGTWTDFTSSKQYTVVSGNRQVRKQYTVTVTVQQ